MLSDQWPDILNDLTIFESEQNKKKQPCGNTGGQPEAAGTIEIKKTLGRRGGHWVSFLHCELVPLHSWNSERKANLFMEELEDGVSDHR